MRYNSQPHDTLRGSSDTFVACQHSVGVDQDTSLTRANLESGSDANAKYLSQVDRYSLKS